MSSGFVHSVKVPRLYKYTADIVRRVREDGSNLKSLIFEAKHRSLVSTIYALSMNTLRALPQLDQLLERISLLVEQPRLDPWLARVLITELLWGKKKLQSEAKPVQTVLAYADKLKEEAKSLEPVSHKTKVLPRYVRINTIFLSVEEAISLFEEEGWTLLSRSATYSLYLLTISRLSEPYFIQDFHIPELFVFPSGTIFYKHPGYEKGKLLLQDKASCLPVHLLNPDVGSTVLDICAAPGMKATHLAAKLQNVGRVYAVEIDTARYRTLVQLVEKAGATCVYSINQDALTLDPRRYSSVEYILVDPSCSGSGIVVRPEESDAARSDPERLKTLHSIQVYLLRYALFNFPGARRVVYSTCSVHPEENEEVVDEVLAEIGDAYRLAPVEPLLPGWTNFSAERYRCGDRCLYARPDIDLCNGFFVAVFERNFDAAIPECTRKGGNAHFRADPDVKPEDEEKEVPHQEERGKNAEGLLTTGKVETANPVVNETKTSESKKEVLETDACPPTNLSREEMKSKKKKKKKSKHKDIPEVKGNNEIIEINGDNTGNEQTKRSEIRKELQGTDACSPTNLNHEEMESKKKKKKKSKHKNISEVKGNNEIIEINGDTGNEQTKRSEIRKEVQETDACPPTSLSREEMESKKSENIRRETEDVETKKKKKKKKSKHKATPEMEENNEITEIHGDNGPTKRKKKKKKDNEEGEKFHVAQEEQEKTEPLTKKKKKKHIIDAVQVDNSDKNKECEGETEKRKKKQKKEKEVHQEHIEEESVELRSKTERKRKIIESYQETEEEVQNTVTISKKKKKKGSEKSIE